MKKIKKILKQVGISNYTIYISEDCEFELNIVTEITKNQINKFFDLLFKIGIYDYLIVFNDDSDDWELIH